MLAAYPYVIIVKHNTQHQHTTQFLYRWKITHTMMLYIAYSISSVTPSVMVRYIPFFIKKEEERIRFEYIEGIQLYGTVK